MPRPDASSIGSDDSPVSGEPVYIDNAGLVLAGPFVRHLFEKLNLLATENGHVRLRDGEAAARAAHLLQYLVDARTAAPEPEPDLALNKILCGVPVETPIGVSRIKLTDDERSLCDMLLSSMIARWEIIKDSSIAALRETFLQRVGKLERVDNGWHLRVNRKTVDVLVDRVPWSIAVVYHPWMPQPLHVTW